MKLIYNPIFLTFTSVIIFFWGCEVHRESTNTGSQFNLQPYTDNPFYWQVNGEPVLLIGASDYHNIFQRPDLVEHLEKLNEAGGNYVRNTMASREILPGHRDHWPYEVDWNASILPHQTRNPLIVVYDLNRWNEAYWDRFSLMLQTTADLGMVVEIEIWERHDKYRTRDQAGWERHPYNPDNNVNYTAEESGLPTGEWTQDPGHPFFATVPALGSNELVLGYQRAFVDKILSYTFEYSHVLYNMNNETKESNEWGEYWAEYILQRAEEHGLDIYITDMQDAHDITDESVIRMAESGLFTFVDISQNNFQTGDTHWQRIQFIRNLIVDNPKPITSVKIYGADGAPAPIEFWGTTQDAKERFWRNIIGGVSAVRFHRPRWGIGLNEEAVAHIRSAVMFASRMNFFKAEPRLDLLHNREPDSAWLLANPGVQYAIYFANGGSAELIVNDNFYGKVEWLDINNSSWQVGQTTKENDKLFLQAPDNGHWLALVEKK